MFPEINFSKIFTTICRKRKEFTAEDPLLKCVTEEYDDLSKRLNRSKIQDSGLCRGTLRARAMADLVLNSSGQLDLDVVEKSIKLLNKHLYVVGPDRIQDSSNLKHLLKALTHLSKCSATQKMIHQFTRPESHTGAEQVIRETLDIPSGTLVTDRHVRQAVLSAWFTYLRQSVGSCFATAPAIILQSEQPDQFLFDLKEMLETGRLKRIANGQEIHAPLSTSWGVGDLRKPLILESHNEKVFFDVGASPGLLSALTEAGVIERAKNLKERLEESRELVVKAIRYFDRGGLYFAVTAEQLLKYILLRHFDLEEGRYDEWLKRPRQGIFGNLMMQVTHADVGLKGFGEAATKMMVGFEEAKSAFKRIAENALLKTWEFTVASFAETKAEFSNWNLYSSLGFNAEEKGGIGACFYEVVKERLDQANQKVQEYQQEYEVLYSQLIYAEGRVRAAQTEKEINWLKAEYQSKYNEFQTFEMMRNREHNRAQRLANLYSDLIQRYLSLFPRYFQEVYDAEVHEASAVLWDDRPAGFRLLFKHGRMNTAQWSRIDSPDSFSDALASFFSLTESEISYSPEFEGLEQDISDMVTRAINHVKTKEFLESALWRMSRIHKEPLYKDPLDHLDLISKKPWAYTSGGSLVSLVASYFNLKDHPHLISRFIESESELIQFLVDLVKQLPPNVIKIFKDIPNKKLLMQSPTHAFNLLPELASFKDAWEREDYTYTWIRDNYIHPSQMYWERYVVTRDKFEKIIESLMKQVPLNFQPRFRQLFDEFPGERSPSDLANYIGSKAFSDRGLMSSGKSVINQNILDITFYTTLPYLSKTDAINKGEEVFLASPLYKDLWMLFLESLQHELFSTHELIERLQGIYIAKWGETSYDIDVTGETIRLAREAGWLAPEPIIFADTNWPRYFFAMLVSPSSGVLELWRVDRLGLNGAPMSEWKGWVNGSNPQSSWGVLSQPKEYTK